jgi:hypothetical protein
VGITGPNGADGPYGVIGGKGARGITGDTGPQGAEGICYGGHRGDTGAQGPQGGSTGAQGPDGVPGTNSRAPSINTNFSFIISNTNANYTISEYVDLVGISNINTIPIVSLTSGTYAINWDIYESWSSNGSCDLLNKFYVSLYNLGTGVIVPNVFTSSNPTVLKTITNNQLFSAGNDSISVPSGNYIIMLLQSTASSTTYSLSQLAIKFSITFVRLT